MRVDQEKLRIVSKNDKKPTLRSEAKQDFFRSRLMEWFKTNHRPMPWKGERNPYLIWLSEIILQQTRVEQGWSYFEKFKKQYPTVQDLAAAPEDDVMKLWQGLGYYSRARNLHETARYIANELDGQFPDTFETLLSLKGVGEYTASAIASFAYDLPTPVVDGNVYRVLSRFFGIDLPIDSTPGKKQFKSLAAELIDSNAPADYNQAIMDFGATFCKPKKPNCKTCLHQSACLAFQEKRVDELPVKRKKLARKTRFFHYLVINENDLVWIQRREGKDIWKNLYQFPLIESTELLEKPELMRKDQWNEIFKRNNLLIKRVSKAYKQVLSHQEIVAVFYEIEIESDILPLENSWKKIERRSIERFAVPKIIDCFLKDKSLSLDL